MTAAISNALGLGYTANQILQHLSRLYPQQAKQIKKALAAGYSADQVLKYLEGGRKGLAKSANEGLTEHEKYLKGIKERESDLNKNVASGLLGAAGLVGGGAFAASRLGQAGRAILPNAILPAQRGLPNRAMQAPQLPFNPPNPPPGTPVTPPNIPPSPGTPSPVNIQSPKKPNLAPAIDLIKSNRGAYGVLQSLLKNKTSPADIKGVINKFYPSIVKQAEKTAGITFEELIQNFPVDEEPSSPFQQQETPIQQTQQIQPSPEVRTLEPQTQNISPLSAELNQNISEPNLQPEVSKEPLKRGDLISTQDGIIGEVKALNNRDAIIESDGKTHKVSLEDIEQTSEEVIQAVQNILKIPEVDRSSVVSLFTYDPIDNEMYIQYHNGESYKYLDMDKNKIHILANKLGIPITEGKNIFGAWSQEDKNSLGAALIKEILKDPKYAKSNENKTWRKLGTYYDYWKKLRKQPKRKRS